MLSSLDSSLHDEHRLPPLTVIDWQAAGQSLDSFGYADLGRLLTDDAADALAARFDEHTPYRSHIHMRRHGFGEGEYKYFAYPLPPLIAELRRALYPPLAAVANRWAAELGAAQRFPDEHDAFLETCHRNSQTRPTPLILRYRAGDYNCLHQDIYGALTFPLQVVILLTDPSAFDGGELVLVEQRPRMQSRAEVVQLKRGHGVVFAVNERPRQGTRGSYRVKQHHGVSRLRAGERLTLGIIFHDAA